LLLGMYKEAFKIKIFYQVDSNGLITACFNGVVFFYFYLGELREAQKMMLCCLPKPILAMLSCIFGEKPYLKQCGSWFKMILLCGKSKISKIIWNQVPYCFK
jgi:hypothetical protein